MLGRLAAEGRLEPLDADLQADMYERATDVLAAAGFHQYELSNWARPGHASRHNQVYWRDGDYLGLGAGAHGYFDGQRYENIANPRAYIAALAAQPCIPPISLQHQLDPATTMSDWLALRLRLVEGFTTEEFAAKFGVLLSDVAGPALNECAAAGLVDQSENRVRLSRRGRQLHSEVAVRLLLHLRASPAAV